MTFILRLLSFVPPTLFCVLPAFSTDSGKPGLLSEPFGASAPLLPFHPPPALADTLDLYVFGEQNPVPCTGQHSDIMVQAFGGLQPYTVDWNCSTTGLSGSVQIPDFEGGVVLDDMYPGDYTFVISDALDSTRQAAFTLAQPSPLSIELQSFAASCNGSMDGVAFVDNAYGGTVADDYQYFWNTSPGTSSASIGFLNPDTYSVTVVDDNGCSTSGAVAVETFAVIFPNPVFTHITCHGAGDGVIDLYPIGASPPFTYQWSPNVATGAFSSAWHLEPGFYSITITDATEVCTESASFTIVEPPAIVADFATTEPRCFGDPGLLKILAVENAVLPWQASIEGEGIVAGETEFEVTPGFPQRLVVEDAKGCTIFEDFLIPAKQEMRLELGEDRTIKYGEQVQFDPVVFPTEGVSLEWSPADWLSCTDCPDPVAKPTETTTYSLRMVDSSGCELVDQATVSVRISRDLYIPNAFSPNFDGVNDRFCPFGGNEILRIQEMDVFDRWGGLLYDNEEGFSLKDPDSGWDGSARGKPADPGTYLFTMNVEFVDGEVVLFAGEVQLMR